MTDRPKARLPTVLLLGAAGLVLGAAVLIGLRPTSKEERPAGPSQRVAAPIQAVAPSAEPTPDVPQGPIVRVPQAAVADPEGDARKLEALEDAFDDLLAVSVHADPDDPRPAAEIDEDLRDALKEKGRLLTEVQRRATELIGSADVRTSASSLIFLGDAHEEMADALATFPLPSGLSAAQSDHWAETMREKSDAQFDHAESFWERASVLAAALPDDQALQAALAERNASSE